MAPSANSSFVRLAMCARKAPQRRSARRRSDSVSFAVSSIHSTDATQYSRSQSSDWIRKRRWPTEIRFMQPSGKRVAPEICAVVPTGYVRHWPGTPVAAPARTTPKSRASRRQRLIIRLYRSSKIWSGSVMPGKSTSESGKSGNVVVREVIRSVLRGNSSFQRPHAAHLSLPRPTHPSMCNGRATHPFVITIDCHDATRMLPCTDGMCARSEGDSPYGPTHRQTGPGTDRLLAGDQGGRFLRHQQPANRRTARRGALRPRAGEGRAPGDNNQPAPTRGTLPEECDRTNNCDGFRPSRN